MLASVVDNTAVVVVRAPRDDVDINCGGHAMVDAQSRPALIDADPDQMAGSLLGKRYVDEQATIELLCTKEGQGTLVVDGQALTMKAAKPLPSSD
jgi:hypothetical protein